MFSLKAPVLAISARLPLNNGHSIPQLGLGTSCLDGPSAQEAVRCALECGYRHIDCAKIYGNQVSVGAALRAALQKRRITRSDLFISSKLWPTDQHPNDVEPACRETLAELGLQYLDLYLIHWPICWRHTAQFVTEEDKYPKNARGTADVERSVKLIDTWRAMSRLVDVGLVRSIGLANCGAAEVREVMELNDVHYPVLNGIELHPAHCDTGLIALHGHYNMRTMAYCPLGMPTQFTSQEFVPLLHEESVQRMADYAGVPAARLLLNWSVEMFNAVVVRSGKAEHIQSNAKAARNTLNPSIISAINSYRIAQRSFRVMNPVNFTEEGGPFFPSLK